MNIRTFTRRLAAGGLAIGAMVAVAPPLPAAVVISGYAPELIPQRIVNLRDLDLTQPAGVAAAYARIRKAALAVCGGVPVTGSRLLSVPQQDCIATSVESAVATINRGELTAYHRHEKAGGSEHPRGAGS
jgi:UrcA family protein